MIYSLQRASTLKRFSAWLLDAIMLCVVATLMLFILSVVFQYDSYIDMLDARYAAVEAEYGVGRDLTIEQVNAMTPEQLAQVEAASQAIASDPEAVYAYNMIVQLIILMTSLGLLLAFMVTEFAVPMLLGNGQTLGKKVFGIGVMLSNGVRVNGVTMFARTVLGKYTIETMIPVMMALMLYFGAIGMTGWLIAGVIVLVQIALFASTRERCLIHDKLANTVTVDLPSQMIFRSQEELIAYKEKVAAEKAANQLY